MKFVSRIQIKLSYIFIVALVSAGTLVGAPQPNPFFSTGVVLARDQDIVVFGDQATPGETVTVRLSNRKATTTAGTNGAWRVKLAALHGGGPFTLTIAAPSGQTTVEDVAVGDLWLCAGQSNMGFSVKDSDVARLATNSPFDSRLRFFNVPLGRKPEPQEKFSDNVKWKLHSPDQVGGESAVAWAFGHYFRQQTKVPVGIVTAAWGGTRAICWTPRAALEQKFSGDLRRFDEKLKQQAGKDYDPPFGHSDSPTDIYNAVIHPLTPIAFTGVIWYQGEQDAGMGLEYKDALTTMISGWRSSFSAPKLPFLVVQLPGFGGLYSEGFPSIREAQALAVKETPNTALVVSVDTGDAKNIHPSQKQAIGQRIALAVAGFVHGQKVVWHAPEAQNAWVTGDGVRVKFNRVGKKLISLDGQPIRAFELAGEDGKYIDAQAEVDPKDQFAVIVRGVSRPTKVRYACKPWPDANLGAGNLAVAPFELTAAPAEVSCATLPTRVLVIENRNSPASLEISAHYQKLRKVQNVLSVSCQDSATNSANETMNYTTYVAEIEEPLRSYLAGHPQIDFIVLTKGIPLRLTDATTNLGGNRPSLDSYLAALDYQHRNNAVRIVIDDSGVTGTCWHNHYWNARERFTHAKFGGYLVTRLDGYTIAEAKGLVDHAVAAEKSNSSALFLLDTHSGFPDGDVSKVPVGVLKITEPGHGVVGDWWDYQDVNADIIAAGHLLTGRGLNASVCRDAQFAGSTQSLAGYFSWGSNDPKFDAKKYQALSFLPGAVADTVVSTSARTFLPTKGGQSLIGDLIRNGITGVKGYCDEPLSFAVASPTIMFDRYTRGWTLAESFYAASRLVGWEDVVIGDPLCQPSAYKPIPNR